MTDNEETKTNNKAIAIWSVVMICATIGYLFFDTIFGAIGSL